MSQYYSFGEQAESSGGGAWFLNHLPSIMWRRKALPILGTLAGLVLGSVAAFLLPTIYRSEATLLVEKQTLPNAVADSQLGGGIEQRIAKIRETILSRGDLINLIQQNDLYASELKSKPMSAILTNMRESTLVGAINNDLAEGQGRNQTIAVTLSFDYSDPVKAQSVLQSYVTNFLKIDSNAVADQAALSVRFLEDQAADLSTKIQAVESQITALKARNGSILASSGGPMLMDTGSYSARIADLENQNRQLMAEAQKQSGDGQLGQAEALLSSLKTRYSDSHPDVIAAEARVRELRATSGGRTVTIDPFTKSQIDANNKMIAQLTTERAGQIARANAAIAGQAQAPAILEQAGQLESQAQALRAQFNAVSDDLLKAKNNARLADEQREERLTLVDSPSLPDTPKSPNRPLLIAGATVAGLALGLFIALALEMLKRPMRSPGQISGMGYVVLGVVPDFSTVKTSAPEDSGDEVTGWRRWLPWRKKRAVQ